MRTLTRNEVAIVTELLGGDGAVRAMINKARLQNGWVPPKYPDVTGGQVEAFFNIALKEVGDDHLPDILAGRLTPKWEEVIRLLVDCHGCCIPEGLKSSVVDHNRNFRQDQAILDTAGITERLNRVKEFWPFPAAFPSVDEVEGWYQATLRWLNSSENEKSGVKNLLNAPHFLGVMPKISSDNHGEILEKLVEAAGRSYQSRFPDRQFYNHRRGGLAGKVEIADGVRYGRFVKAATQGQEPVVWVSFRVCLQGFSIQADREQEARMPARFILSGGWDTAADAIAYPDVLFRDYHTPGLDCAASVCQSDSLFFMAIDDRLNFGYRNFKANGRYSGGLLVLKE